MAEPHAPSRMYDLLAQAETMLRCGPEFWLGVGLGSETHQHLAVAARELRERECAFCLLLSERIDLMVQHQALDREAWELISLCRAHLKTTLGSQWSTRWAPAGFAEGTLKVPERPEQRLLVLRRLSEYFRLHPEQQPEPLPGADRLPEVLVEEIATVLGQIEDCRHALRDAVRARRNALAMVRQSVQEAVRQVHDRLRQADLRWQKGCFAIPAAEEHIAVRRLLPRRIPSSRHARSLPAIVSRHRPGVELQDPWSRPAPAARRVAESARIPQPATGCTRRTVASAAVANARSEAPMSDASSPPPVLLGTVKLASVIAWLFPPVG